MGVSQRPSTSWALRHRRCPAAEPATQPVPGVLSLSGGADSASRQLPELATLEYFGVPFATYDARGRPLYVSRQACTLLDDPAGCALLRAECEWLVSEALGTAVAGSSDGAQWDHMTLEVDSCAITAFRVSPVPSHLHLLDRTALVVVFGPLGCQRPEAVEQLPFGLTPREREVAALIASGLSTKEIAGRLDISFHTTKRHTERVYRKLGVHGRMEVSRVIRTLRLAR